MVKIISKSPILVKFADLTTDISPKNMLLTRWNIHFINNQKNKHRRKKIRLLATEILATMLFIVMYEGCNSSEKSVATTSGADGGTQVQVSATLPPIEYFVKQIGGDRVKVNVLLRNGADPETFEPGISTMKLLSESKLLFSTGLMPFEQTIAQKYNDDKGKSIILLSDSIDIITGTHEHAEASGHHRKESSHRLENADPHIWMSAGNGRIIAKTILNALTAADTAGKAEYRANFNQFIARLDSMEGVWGERLKPLKGKTFVVTHPSLSYFARDYNLQQIALADGSKEESVQSRVAVIETTKEVEPLAFFVEYGSDKQKIRQSGAAMRVEPTEVNTLSADWEQAMNIVVSALTTGNNARR